METRRERLKSALYLKLKKRETFFWKKTFENFSPSENVALCRKIKKEGPLRFINMHSVAKYQKTQSGTLWDITKFSKKSRTVSKKNGKWGIFSPVRFCRLP